MRRLRALFACTLLACGGGGSGNPAPPADAGAEVFVGPIQGTDGYGGLVVGSNDALIFFCGGSTHVATLTHWFHHAAIAGGASFDLTDGSFTASGSKSANGWTGTYSTPSGGPYPWSLAPAALDTAQGVYWRVIADAGNAGAVVAPSGADVAFVGAFKTLSSGILEVTPLDRPVTVTAQGLHVEASLSAGGADGGADGGTLDFYIQRAEPYD